MMVQERFGFPRLLLRRVGMVRLIGISFDGLLPLPRRPYSAPGVARRRSNTS